jgi:hypothetical protein
MYKNFLSKNKNLNRSQKQKRLENLRKEMDQIFEWDNEDGKRIKRYIDESIKEMIVLLNALGFRTASSCEGFIRDPIRNIKGKKIKLLSVSQPYVIIAPKPPTKKGWEEIEKEYRKMQHETSECFYNIVALLNQFYKRRKVPYDIILAPHEHNIYTVIITNIGSEALEELGEDEKQKKMKAYQKEWVIFTKFLRKIYFK